MGCLLFWTIGRRTHLNAARMSAAGEGLTEPNLNFRHRRKCKSTPVSCSKTLPDPYGFGSFSFFRHAFNTRFWNGEGICIPGANLSKKVVAAQ